MEDNKNNIDDIVLDDKKEFKIPENNNKDGKRSLILLFFTTFVFGIIIVSFFLKGLAPNMDLDIGENPVASMNQRGDEDDYNVRSQIDQRLKMIQNDDEMPGVSERTEDEGYEKPEDIVKRLREKVDGKNKEDNEPEIYLQKNENDSPSIESVRIQTQDAPQQSSISKIYIGQFSSMEKAVEMQEAVINSDLGVNPVIKSVNGYYTIQVGAFSNPEAAKNLSNQLINAGFAAKTVKEIR